MPPLLLNHCLCLRCFSGALIKSTFLRHSLPFASKNLTRLLPSPSAGTSQSPLSSSLYLPYSVLKLVVLGFCSVSPCSSAHFCCRVLLISMTSAAIHLLESPLHNLGSNNIFQSVSRWPCLGAICWYRKCRGHLLLHTLFP